MKSRIRKALVKLLALLLVIILTFPAEVVAQSLNEERKDYTKDTSLMGLNEKDDKDDPGDKSAQNQERKTLLQSDIQKASLEKLDIEKSVSLSKTTGEIIYKILITNKEDNNEKLGTLQTIFSINKNSKQNDLHIQKITSFDENGNEVEIDAKENKPFFQSDEIKTLSSTSQVEGKSVIYYLSSKIDDETFDKIKNDEKFNFTLDLLIKNGNKEIIHQERIAFKEKEINEITAEQENKDQKVSDNFDLEFIENISQVEGEYKDNSNNLLAEKTNEITWTDFIFQNYDKKDQALNYKFIVDGNQDTTDSLIKVDFYEASDEGFVINKTYSQEIPYTEETELQIPQGFIAKIALTTKVKEGANPKEFTFNNKIIANPSYKEESEKTDEENKTEEKSEDPLPEENTEENKEEQKKENSDKKENTEKSETKVEEEKPSDSKDKKENQTSPIDLNKDALINKYQSQEKLSEELKAQIEEITKTLNSYNEEKITEEEFKTNLKENSKDLKKEEVKEILQSLIAGLNEEKFKVAKLPVDEIIADIYKEESKEEKEKEKTNLEKADQELKAALADEKKTIEEIQNLLTSLGEKYQLSREDQEKLMTENDAAIKALVEKDRKENFRPLNLMTSNSFADKQFNLKVTLQVKASPINPIPGGSYFDVKFGPFLKKDPNEPIKDVYLNGNKVASAQYVENGVDHYIRYYALQDITQNIDLQVEQLLAFDTINIGTSESIDVTIKVKPERNPEQAQTPIRVSRFDDSPVQSDYVVKDEVIEESGTYPYHLEWTSKQSFENGNVVWDIEVDTAPMRKANVDFNNLNITLFSLRKQGFDKFTYEVVTNELDLGQGPTRTSSSLGEILQADKSIKKEDLSDKLHIRVKAPITDNDKHEEYSIGLRINTDTNYIDKLLREFKDKFDRIPSPIKWLKGLEETEKFAKVPFNLVETQIPARVNQKDYSTNESFYYDSTRTIIARRISDNRADWYALDLLRIEETEDYALRNPSFYLNGYSNPQSITPDVFYYVPKTDGGYRRTSQVSDALIENGKFYPGTLIAYEYENQKGTRTDTYNFNAYIKEKKVNNLDPSFSAAVTGGNIELFTEKITDQDQEGSYLSYSEKPYPIIRINKNFDMVQCFNASLPDPNVKDNKRIYLDIHENPSGDYLIGRLSENVRKQDQSVGYRLGDYLTGYQSNDDGINLNPGRQKTSGQAMEELMKKIYYYGDEVKREYEADHPGEVMHRIIESSMLQRVLHHFTDGKSLEVDFWGGDPNRNQDDWKVNFTLTGKKMSYPNTGYTESFIGKDDDRKVAFGNGDRLRKLRDGEKPIANYPIVNTLQKDMATKLLNKIIKSYGPKSDWNDDKADMVKLVFYSHVKAGIHQELLTGRVTEPIQIDKYKEDGKTKLKDASFTFINVDTNEKKTWKSVEDNEAHRLYLKPGTYRVTEEAPSGYEKIQDFFIEVKREEVNPDDGSYNFYGLEKIHVNDGFKTKIVLSDIPQSADGKDLVEIDENNNIKVKVINVQDNLGKLSFTKRNQFTKLDGSEFTLRKLTATSLDEAKNQIKNNNLTYDNAYNKSSEGDYGQFLFEQIPEGYYVLEETKVPTGYKKAPLYLLEGKEGTDTDGKKRVLLKFVGDDLPEIRNGQTRIINKPKDTEVKFRKMRSDQLHDNKEHLGLTGAEFRLTSIRLLDGDIYERTEYSDSTRPTEGDDKVDGENNRGGGYITFKGLKVGEYHLEELTPPSGFINTNPYGWKLVVSEITEGADKGKLQYKLYELKNEEDKDKDPVANNFKEVTLDQNIFGTSTIPAFQIGNEPRKGNFVFAKYLTDGKSEPVLAKSELRDEVNDPVGFNLYKTDYYGNIISETPINGNTPIIQNVFKNNADIPKEFQGDEYKYYFSLENLEYGSYYALKEINPPAGYRLAYTVRFQVVEDSQAGSSNKMKLIVRDINQNTKYEENLFKGIIDFDKEAVLGEFSIKKTGNAIGNYYDEDGNKQKVGLRRAYFRLYVADENFDIKLNKAGFPESYTQEATPGEPLTKDDGNGQTGVDPNTLPKNQGIITFSQLRPGKYVLLEHRSPAGYEKDPNPWYIQVNADGSVIKSRHKPEAGGNLLLSSETRDRAKASGLDIAKVAPMMAQSASASRLDTLINSLSVNAKANLNSPARANADGWEDVIIDKSVGRAEIAHSVYGVVETRITQINKQENKIRQVFLCKSTADSDRYIQIHRQPEHGEFNYKRGSKILSPITVYEVDNNSTLDNIIGEKTDITKRTPINPKSISGKPKRVEIIVPRNIKGAVLVEVETTYDENDLDGFGLGTNYKPNRRDTWSQEYWVADSYANEAGVNQNLKKTYKVETLALLDGSLDSTHYGDVEEGTDVTITVTPDPGYELNTLTMNGTDVAGDVINNQYKFKMPNHDVKFIATFKESTTPQPRTYTVSADPTTDGMISISPSENVEENTEVTITLTPNTGKKVGKLFVDGKEVTPTNNIYKFSMPAHNVIVSATFVDDVITPPQPAGDNKVVVKFTYSNQKNGEDNSKELPTTPQYPGTVLIQQKAANNPTWTTISELKNAPYKGKVNFDNISVQDGYEYRLLYSKDHEIAGGWGTTEQSAYKLDFSKAGADKTLTVEIENGNLMTIFNNDETGFRIPLRVTKANYAKKVLQGAQFRAKKITKGSRRLYEDVQGGKLGEVRYVTDGNEDPVFYDEAYDQTSEATGIPGDNYFRELTPGIYELQETKTPDESYKEPLDNFGKPMKWYFEVFVYNGRTPHNADYMGINFYFEKTFDDPNEFVNEEMKKEYFGKKIKGLGSEDPNFNKYSWIQADDGRSNPARPDAPYQGIHDVWVHNYQNKTKFEFYKADGDNNDKLKDAEFSLRKVKIKETKLLDGNKKTEIVYAANGKPEYEGGEDKLEESERVKPYDENRKFAVAKSDNNGKLNFTNIAPGTYILEEVTPPNGYAPRDAYLVITFKEGEDGAWTKVIKGYKKDPQTDKYVEITDYEEDAFINNDNQVLSLKNFKNYIDLKFQKIEGNKEAKSVDSAKFKLTQVDEHGKPIEGGYTDEKDQYFSSKFTFENLPVGRYKLEETRVLQRFEKPSPWYFSVVQDPKTYKLKIVFEEHDMGLSFTPVDDSEEGKNTPKLDKENNPIDIKIRNYDLTQFSFRKVDQDNKGLSNVGFKLVKLRRSLDGEAYEYNADGTSSASAPYYRTTRSDYDGGVSFTDLGEGIYELIETRKPEGFESEKAQDRGIFQVIKTEDGLKVVYDKNFEENYYKEYDKEFYKEYLAKGFKNDTSFQPDTGKYKYKLVNIKNTVDLKFKKYTGNDTSRLIKREIKFVLLKSTDDPNDFEKGLSGQANTAPYELVESDGTFEVKDLTKGFYTLVEIEPPVGYKKMDRAIVIRVYPDKNDNFKLKKEIFEIRKDANDDNERVPINEFKYLRTHKPGGASQVYQDTDGYIYIRNDEKASFAITKGFLTDPVNKTGFTQITKGTLTLKLQRDPKDTSNDDYNVYTRTINLAENVANGYYKFNLDGVKEDKNYILEEVEAPDGYVKTKYKYRLKFVRSQSGEITTLLKAVLDENDQELKNANGSLVTEAGAPIGNGIIINADPNQSLKIVNDKTKIEFTKVGKAGKEETPLVNVGFYLVKQDPKDYRLKNQGYWPVTEDLEYIKTDENGKQYILKADGTKDYGGITSVSTAKNAYKVISNGNGKFTFTNLTDGYYQVIEPTPPKDKDGKEYMTVNGPVAKFRVSEGKVYIKDKDGEKVVTDANKAELAKVINEKPGIGDFSILKKDEKDAPLDSVEYELYKTDPAQTFVKKGTTDSEGKITFDGLPFGYYWLKEIKSKDGYIVDTKKRLISLGGGEWTTPAKATDISDKILFNGKQDELVSTADKPNRETVYPNQSEAMVAKFNFKFKQGTTINPGDHFTIHFSKNVDLYGIVKDNDGKGNTKNPQLDILGPAGKLAEATISEDLRSITYVFTNYVETYTPVDFSIFAQLYTDRTVVDHSQNITVTADIGNNTDATNSDYHYQDDIFADYRGQTPGYSYYGYQNPNTNISSYMLRLDPDGKTFTTIIYVNQWNKDIKHRTVRFITDQDVIADSISVRTFRKEEGTGSHPNNWQEGDLPDSYMVDYSKLKLISESKDSFTTSPGIRKEVITPPVYSYDSWEYDYNTGRYIYYRHYTDNTITKQINIKDSVLNGGWQTNEDTYVIEIKGKLKDTNNKVKSFGTESRLDWTITGSDGYDYTYRDNFFTWSQFYDPGAIGNTKKEIILYNIKNRIDFVKVDGGVISNVADHSGEKKEELEKLGVGKALGKVELKLQKEENGTFVDVDDSKRITDSDGKFYWEGLATGKYQVIETKSADDKVYELPKDPLSTFEVDEHGNITKIKNEDHILENYKKAELRIRKTDALGNTLDGAVFLLEKLDDEGVPAEKKYTANTGVVQDDKTILFANLLAGQYLLTEQEAPKGYQKTNDSWTIEVTRDGKVKWLDSTEDTTNDFKSINEPTYTTGNGDRTRVLTSQIIGLNTKAKKFRQKITLKAKPSELKNRRILIKPSDPSIKLSDINSKVRLAVSDDETSMVEADPTTYRLQINNGDNPNLALTILPPYKAENKDQTAQTEEEYRYYNIIVDMPYVEGGKVGANIEYQESEVIDNEVQFKKIDELVKYVAKSTDINTNETDVDMATYQGKYLTRDVNLVTTDIGNYKKPTIYFEKDDEKTKKKLEGAEFRLMKDYGSKVGYQYVKVNKNGEFVPFEHGSAAYDNADFYVVKSDENGKIKLENLDGGKYRLIEIKAPNGYVNKSIDFVFAYDFENGKVAIFKNLDNPFEVPEKVENSEDNPIQITNTENELRIRKTDADGNTLTGAEFWLEKRPSETQDYVANGGEVQADGTILFKGLKVGDYTLTEKKAPSGYIGNKLMYIKVTSDGKIYQEYPFAEGHLDLRLINQPTYTTKTDDSKGKITSEVIAIDKELKRFRQIITIKAKPSEIERSRLLIHASDPDIKLSNINSQVGLQVSDDGTNFVNRENEKTYYSYKINNGTAPNLEVKISEPVDYDSFGRGIPINEEERYYKFVVEMPYKEGQRVGAKVEYQGSHYVGNDSFEYKTDSTLDKYVEKSTDIVITDKKVKPTLEEGNKYLNREISEFVLDIGNVKKPDIYFEKVDENDKTKKLEGGTFVLEIYNPKVPWVPFFNEDHVAEVTSDKDGIVKFEGVEPYKTYRITETKAPNGYAKKKFEFYFKVNENGEIIKLDDPSQTEGTKIDNSKANPIQLTNPALTYPHTGGPGVWIGFSLIGLAVMITGVLIYGNKKQKLA